LSPEMRGKINSLAEKFPHLERPPPLEKEG
jgi:hypothetical protein